MEHITESAKRENWLDEMSQQIKMRFGDVFFSYLIMFEIIYNWKFVYTLFVGNKEKSVQVIELANGFLIKPDYLNYIYNILGRPSTFTLAILSSIFMTVVYPFIYFSILFLRKRIFYFTNKKLESDYPTRQEYKSVKIESNRAKEEVIQVKSKRYSDMSSIGQVLIKDNILIAKEKIHYALMIASEKSSFDVDEMVQRSKSNATMIEKVDPTQFNREDLYLIFHKITVDVFLVAKIGPEIPVSRNMIERGKDYVALTNLGYPLYLDKNELEKINLEGKSIVFYATIEKGKDLAKVKDPFSSSP